MQFVAAAVFLRTSTSNTSTFYGKIETQNKFCIISNLRVLKRDNNIALRLVGSSHTAPSLPGINAQPFPPGKQDPCIIKIKGEGHGRKEMAK